MNGETEILVTIQMAFPQTDLQTLAQHLADVMTAAVAAGGLSTSVSLQQFDPSDDLDG